MGSKCFSSRRRTKQSSFAKGKNEGHIHRDKMTDSEFIEGKEVSHGDSWKNVFTLEKS